MFYYAKADVTNTSCRLIVHGCNAQGVMGSGVAKAIRAKWPGCYTLYRDFYNSGTMKTGLIIPYIDEPGDKYIINAITQEFYGRDKLRYVSYDAIEEAFAAVNRYCRRGQFDAIAIPKIGAGLGGGDWDIIRMIIEKTMVDADVVVYSL